MLCKPPVLFGTIARSKQTRDISFKPTGGRCQAVIRNLPLQVTVAEIETFQKDRLHIIGEGAGSRGRTFQHFVAAVDQVPGAALMKRRQEFVVDTPSVVNEEPVEFRDRKAYGFIVTAARHNSIDGGVFGHRRPEPPEASAHSPARFVHGNTGTGANLADEILVGRFAFGSHAPQAFTQTAP